MIPVNSVSLKLFCNKINKLFGTWHEIRAKYQKVKKNP